MLFKIFLQPVMQCYSYVYDSTLWKEIKKTVGETVR